MYTKRLYFFFHLSFWYCDQYDEKWFFYDGKKKEQVDIYIYYFVNQCTNLKRLDQIWKTPLFSFLLFPSRPRFQGMFQYLIWTI